MGWKGPQGSPSSNPPATVRATNLQIWCLTWLPRDLVLNTFSDGASTTSLGSLFQHFTTLLGEKLHLSSITCPEQQALTQIHSIATSANPMEHPPLLLQEQGERAGAAQERECNRRAGASGELRAGSACMEPTPLQQKGMRLPGDGSLSKCPITP